MALNFVFALAGLVAGAIINALADDLPARRQPSVPHCTQCGHPYEPSHWLALGRLLQGGRCPQCGAILQRRYITVELVTMAIFALLPSLITNPVDLLFGAVYIAILILVIVIDLEYRLILHKVTLPSTALALAGSLFISGNSLLLALLGAGLGFIVFYGLYWLGKQLFGPGALGFGDVTLSMTLGAMLGFPYVVFALVLGIMLGGLISFGLIVSGRLSMRSYVAYGPFLAMAGIITVVWGQQILSWYLG
ncbi:MAG TPA: A24 family peptidase [Candidatus Binatia bacterium]|nr:A24 family peptidase [Candidatus Binatia bacterium]